nr:PilW family protein [Crenobacter caeni]
MNLNRASRGFTLVELMVGIAVGLLVVLAVTQSVAFVNQQRKATTGGNDAQENAQAALVFLDGALRLAGNGMSLRESPFACTSYNAYYDPPGGGSPVTVSGGTDLGFIPGVAIPRNGLAVRLQGGAGVAPDALTVYSAPRNINGVIGDAGLVQLSGNMPVPSANIDVDGFADLKEGELILIKDPTNPSMPCSLHKITGLVSGGLKIQANPGANGEYNPSGTPPWTNFSYSAGSLVLRAPTPGNQLLETNSYNLAASRLQHCAGELGCASPTALVDGIVQLQAQYGVSASAASKVVSQWVEPTGAWANPSSADAKRIRAVRLVVVARSAEVAPDNVTAACTNAAGVSNTGPCSFQDAAAPVIDLSAVSVPAGRTWQNYRYRVYTTVVPLRNVVWNI